MLSALWSHYCDGQCEVASPYGPLCHSPTQGPCFMLQERPLLSSYQQEEMYSLQPSKGKSFRKWDVRLSSPRVSISITKMTQLHNRPKVMRFPSGFLHWWAAPGSKSSTEAPSGPKCRPNILQPHGLMKVFALVRFDSCPFILMHQNDQRVFLYKQESKNPRVRPQRHLLKYSKGCVWMFTCRGGRPPSCSLCHQTCPGLLSRTPRAHN